MMKTFSVLLTIFLLGYSGVVTAKHFWRGKTMSAQQVGERWGKAAFDALKFREGDESIRAKMAFSLMKETKKFQEKDPVEIRKELGTPDGFYFSDLFPAYLILSAKTRKEEAWQIVFLLDRDKKVSEIIVHKNCCD